MANDTSRLSIDMTSEQRVRLAQLVPWGSNRRVFSRLLDALFEFLENDQQGLAAFYTDTPMKLTKRHDQP